MADKVYSVLRGFAAVDESTNRKVYFTPANAYTIPDVLSAKQIREQEDAGTLSVSEVEDADDIPLEATAAPVEDEAEGEEGTTRRSGRKRGGR